jgi:hypothetical protein
LKIKFYVIIFIEESFNNILYMKNIKIKSIKARQKTASKTAEDFFKKAVNQPEPLETFPKPYRPRRPFFISLFI